MFKYIVSFIKLLQFPRHLLFLFGVYVRYFLGIQTPPLKNIRWNSFSMDKTFIRWGDGETMVALGIPMVFTYQFEDSSVQLSKMMKQIITDVRDDIVLGLAKKYLVSSESETEDIRAWIITRAFFNSAFVPPDRLYDDAFFYRNLATYDRFLDLYRGKKIVLVSNAGSIKKVIDDGRLDVIDSFELPSSHSFDRYDELQIGLFQKMSQYASLNSDIIILISGGPTGKILAYNLTVEKGFICHDAGQFFDLYLN